MSLAKVFSDAREYGRAVTELNTLARHCDDTFGRDAPISRVAQFNLGNTLIRAGEYRAAAAIYEAHYASDRASLGPDGPASTSSTSSAGHEDIAGRRAQTLSEKHPETLTACSNLANTLAARGDLEPARDLMASVLADREEILRPEHPATLSTREPLELNGLHR